MRTAFLLLLMYAVLLKKKDEQKILARPTHPITKLERIFYTIWFNNH